GVCAEAPRRRAACPSGDVAVEDLSERSRGARPELTNRSGRGLAAANDASRATILPDVDEATTVESMHDYYVRRATYYERVYLKPERQRDLRTMEAWLPSMFVGRRVLEVACGTGWWTPHGASFAREWLATDLNP